jgi:hypothetical protein
MPSIRSAAKWLAVQVEARRKTAMAVNFPVAAIPASFATSSVLHYGVEVSTKDDWAMPPVILKAQTGQQLRFSDLFQLQQEARTILPKLIFILSAAGGHWNIRELMILSVIICCITAAGIYWHVIEKWHRWRKLGMIKWSRVAVETTDRRWIAFALSGEVTIRRYVARQLRNGNQLWSRASPSLSSKCGTSSGSSCAGRDTLQS